MAGPTNFLAATTGGDPTAPKYGPTAVRYIIEVYEARNLAIDNLKPSIQFKRAIEIPLVNHYDYDRTESTLLTWTLGEFPVREHSGVREQSLTIRGRSGVDVRLGVDAQGADLFASGTDLFREFEAFMRQYQTDARDAEAKRNNTELLMVVRALWEQHNFFVEPRKFHLFRTTGTSRHSYEYDMRLTAYAEAQAPALNLWGQVAELAKKATKYIDQASAYILKADQMVAEFSSAMDAWIEPVNAVRRVIESSTQLVNTSAGVYDLHRKLMNAVFRVAEAGILLTRATIDAIPHLNRTEALKGWHADALGAMQDAQMSALNWLGYDNSSTVNTPTPVDIKGYVTNDLSDGEVQAPLHVISYTVKEGDTLESIAEKLVGTPDGADEIAELNGMPDTLTAPNGAPLYAGLVLVIPTDEDHGVAGALADKGGVFGVDFALTASSGGFDLMPVGGENPTDIALIKGPPLLTQALIIRFLTRKGEHAVFPGYGILNLIGTPALLKTRGLLASDVLQQSLAEKRIDRVARLSVLDRGDGYEVDCTLVAKGGEPLDLRIPISGGAK